MGSFDVEVIDEKDMEFKLELWDHIFIKNRTSR